MKKSHLFLILTLVFTSCAELQTMVYQYAGAQKMPLTSSEVARGLKEALKIGSNNAANILSAEDGFYKDELVRILLPPEAQSIVKNIQMIPGGRKLIEEVEIRLNRAAEDAVKEAAPIFVNAITEMTIADAFGILKGEKNAATLYLKSKTYDQLQQLFMPKVKASLDKKLLANLSTNESWDKLAGTYNRIAGSFAGKLANLEEINTRLDEYVTTKALDALFLKLENEEMQIRQDPMKRVNDILKRVFGSVD